MSGQLERGVAVGPHGLGDEQRYVASRRFYGETACAWLRVWADWPTLQPAGTAVPDFEALDRDIAAARADGLKVMLTAYRFARWANGTEAIPENVDPSHDAPDRLPKAADPARRKQLSFRIPDDLGPDSYWARWIGLLVERYRRGGSGGDAWVDAIEIFNEPNLQMWPQRAPARGSNPFALGDLTLQKPVARMIASAREVFDRFEDPPLLVAPALSDRQGSSRLDTDYLELAEAVLDELDAIGFEADSRTAWSHHSYADVEGDTGERAAAMRNLLVGRWAGWPTGDAGEPGLMITETGARLTTIAKREGLRDDVAVRRRQAELLQRNLERVRLGPEGAGIDVYLHYLFVTDMNYDAGLCELDGTPRPAYRVWAELPTLR